MKLADDEKKVEGGAFFNVEALPEGTVLVFPIALKQKGWKPFGDEKKIEELYFGGLESIGFGHCRVRLAGDYYSLPDKRLPLLFFIFLASLASWQFNKLGIFLAGDY